MAKRITAMVNEVLAQEEPGTKALTEDDVLALIDTGGSEGGSQVCSEFRGFQHAWHKLLLVLPHSN